MISCLLISVTRNKQGLPSRNEIRLVGESLDLGRHTACQIQLADHRVLLRHATLTRAADGTLQIEAAPEATMSIDGFVERQALLRPGTRVGIGPYLLTVEAAAEDADLSLSLTIPETPPAEDTPSFRTLPTNLADLRISKRGLGLAMAAIILLAFLVLPLLPRASSALDEWLPVALTEPLSAGPLSAGHSAPGMKCSACHQLAFRSVADVACTKCHERLAGHAAPGVHEGAFAEVRCADCHAAHQGKAEAIKADASRCSGCHERLGTTVANARDFGRDHPPFRLTMTNGQDLVRVAQHAVRMPPEKPGLKFSHKLHLAKEGVSSPDGDTVLTCRNCHKLEESGNHFAPMSVEMTCQQSRCHKRRFAEPGSGFVPHGSEAATLDRLRGFYVAWLADAPQNAAKCPPPAKAGTMVRRTLDCADELARRHAAATLFRQTGEDLECAQCHEITETGDRNIPWKVAPVRIQRDWQPAASFGHAKHATMACSACHDKAGSATSADIAMPRIEKCRECHAGDDAVSGKLVSNCESCHRFHRRPPSE